MTRLITILFALCLAVPAAAQTTILVIVKAGSVNPSVPTTLVDSQGIRIIPPTQQSGATPIYYQPANVGVAGADGQIMLARYANGLGPPAGQILGWGATSVIQGTSDTGSLPFLTRSIVITEGYTDASGVAVLAPQLCDVTIAGYDVAGDQYATAGAVHPTPILGDPECDDPDLYDGLRWHGIGGLIQNVRIFYIPGTCAVINDQNQKDGGGQPLFSRANGLPMESEKLHIRGLRLRRAWRGIDLIANDSVLGNCEVAGMRDYGVKLTTGSTQIDGGIHIYGVFGNGTAEHLGVGLWCYGPHNWGGPLYLEASATALRIESGSYDNRLGPLFSWLCSGTNCDIDGSYNTLRDAWIYVGRADNDTANIGADIAGAGNQIIGSVFNGEKDDDGDITAGIRLTGSAGTNLVLDKIACHNFLGTTAILVQSTLTDAHIEVSLASVGTGIDLVDGVTSKLGSGNTIIVTTGSGVTTPIEFPAGWVADDGTNAKRTTNKIFIDGRQWWPASDEY